MRCTKIIQKQPISEHNDMKNTQSGNNTPIIGSGRVWLVGAGPGDPDLLTLKALKAIQLADAVIYDRLVADAIIALIPERAERIFAGKSCKKKAMTQDEINSLLVKLGSEGKHVVRLKGGDPLFFGRGGEEALELVKHGIAYEIVPGITSAQGCAAYAGIPLTHRNLATGVRFITGHRTAPEDAQMPLELNWKSLADPDTTIVVYMGLANLEVIASQLIVHGLSPETPVAAIQQGTTKGQKTLLSRLCTIAGAVRDAGFEPPTLVIIGKVAALSADLRWFKAQDTDNDGNFIKYFTELSH
jgi:uroporphyrin-III C-methyltransferase/precorrin-2 dehydrogenase/sirohydrochlorin ferrochelatase/uroporphyrin-III C-methyltransferase